MSTVSAKPFWNLFRYGTLLITLGFIIGCREHAPTQGEVLSQAQELSMAGDNAAAISLLEGFLQDHPGSFDVVDTLAFLYAEEGDSAVAAFFFSRAAEIDPSQPEYLLYAAEALEASGDPAGAVSHYEQFLSARPDDVAIHVRLAQLHESRGNRSAALDAYLQANRRQPSGEIQLELGRLYLQSGNRAVAQTWFASAAQASRETRPDGLLGLLEIAIRAQRYTDAEALVETLDREFPGYLNQSRLAQTRRQLATWRRSQQEAEAALAAMRPPVTEETPLAVAANRAPAETTDPTPDTPPSPAEGEDLSAMADEGIDRGPIALFPDPSEPPPAPAPTPTATPVPSVVQAYENFLSQARTQAREGNHLEAIRNYQRALARNDEDPAVWRDLSHSQFQAGQNSLAAASASEAVRRAPEDPTVLLHYLRVAAPTLTPDRLLRELETARNRFPDSPGIALALGRAYDERGSRAYAGRMYQEFLRLAAPDHPARAEIEALLNN